MNIYSNWFSPFPFLPKPLKSGLCLHGPTGNSSDKKAPTNSWLPNETEPPRFILRHLLFPPFVLALRFPPWVLWSSSPLVLQLLLRLRAFLFMPLILCQEISRAFFPSHPHTAFPDQLVHSHGFCLINESLPFHLPRLLSCSLLCPTVGCLRLVPAATSAATP